MKLSFTVIFIGLDVRCCTVPLNFTFLGLHRELVLASGMVSSSKASIEYMFRYSKTKISQDQATIYYISIVTFDIETYFGFIHSQTKGIVTILLPGGAHEARNWSKNEVKLYLNKRKGFIKLALRFGVDLVPTFSFNEQFIFKQVTAAKGIQ